jgi:hypothetical protein
MTPVPGTVGSGSRRDMGLSVPSVGPAAGAGSGAAAPGRGSGACQNASSDATADAQMAMKPAAIVNVVKVSLCIFVSPSPHGRFGRVTLRGPAAQRCERVHKLTDIFGAFEVPPTGGLDDENKTGTFVPGAPRSLPVRGRGPAVSPRCDGEEGSESFRILPFLSAIGRRWCICRIHAKMKTAKTLKTLGMDRDGTSPFVRLSC